MALKAFVSGVSIHPVIVPTPDGDRLRVSFSSSALFEDGTLIRHPDHEGIQYHVGNKEGGTEVHLNSTSEEIMVALVRDARVWFDKELKREDGKSIQFIWLGDKMGNEAEWNPDGDESVVLPSDGVVPFSEEPAHADETDGIVVPQSHDQEEIDEDNAGQEGEDVNA